MTANNDTPALPAGFAALDPGPWQYHAQPEAAEHVHRYFVESATGSPDVRLYINGNFGDDAERAVYGEALAQALNGLASAEETASQLLAAKEDDGNFNTGDEDLDLLLGLTEDMALGHANMDTGMLWLQTLERVKARLAPPPLS